MHGFDLELKTHHVKGLRLDLSAYQLRGIDMRLVMAATRNKEFFSPKAFAFDIWLICNGRKKHTNRLHLKY